MMKFLLRYLDKFSARSGNHNWIIDPVLYDDSNVFSRLDELQSLGYLVEMTFISEKEVDLESIFQYNTCIN